MGRRQRHSPRNSSKNCAAQAALNRFGSRFQPPIRCGFYQTRLRALYASEKGHGSFPGLVAEAPPDRLVASGRWIFLCRGGKAAGGGLNRIWAINDWGICVIFMLHLQPSDIRPYITMPPQILREYLSSALMR